MLARQPHPSVRPAAVAGTFYPGRAGALEAEIDGLLARAAPSGKERVAGIIAPHAGYMYSGPVAGSAFARLGATPSAFERVLLIGPPHYVPVAGIAAPSSKAFVTPLGEVEIDTVAISALRKSGVVEIDDRAHAPEHALEVELPFLQRILGRFTLVPLLVGDAAPEQTASVIDSVLDERTLLVVSTDLSHYLDYESAVTRDLATAEAIEELDFATLGPRDACGYAALNGALHTGKERGWRIERLDLLNSGDTNGDRDRVVGYGAWAFVP